MVLAPNRKPRLVSDFKLFNSVLPRASSYSPLIWTVLAALRVESRPTMAILDAKSAFYKNRLFQQVLLLRTGLGLFISRRMVFGVGFGPGGLMASLGEVIRLCRDVLEMYPTLISLFVDDASISGETEYVLHALRIVLSAMAVTGFEVPLAKFALISNGPIEAAELRRCGPLVEVAGTGKLLGVTFSYVTNTLIADCSRDERLKAVIAFTQSRNPITKRSIFSLCGSMSYDPLKIHGDCRAVADAMRSLIAKHFATSDWDAPLDINSIPEKLQSAYQCLIVWMAELATEKCSHSTMVALQAESTIFIDAYCDASLNGAGFAIVKQQVGIDSATSTAGELIAEDASRWTSKQRDYHINRRELLCLLKCLQSVSDLVEFRREASTSPQPSRWSVRVHCDNSSCVHWTQSEANFNASSSRAIERRAIGRLVNAISEEIAIINKSCSLRIEHIAGSMNNRADRLSRLFDRPCQGSQSLGDALAPYTDKFDDDGKEVAAIEEMETEKLLLDQPEVPVSPFQKLTLYGQAELIDTLRVLRDSNAERPPRSVIAERWASESYDLNQLFSLAKSTRLIFAILKANVRDKAEDGISIVLDLHTPWDARDVIAVARSAQFGDPGLSDHKRRLPSCGPLFKDKDDVIYHRMGTPHGDEIHQLLIPKTAEKVRSVIIRDAHRACYHGGTFTTIAAIVDFYLPAVISQVKSTTRLCVPCQIARAQRSWTDPPSLSADRVDWANPPSPYHCVGIDFLSIGVFKVLTVTCLLSQHCTWILVDGEDGRNVCHALRLVQIHRGGLKHIYSDRASYFKSDGIKEVIERTLTGRLHLISARAPWEAGLWEKLHDIGLKRLRSVLRNIRGRIEYLTSVQLAEYLEYCTFLLNTRPLGRWTPSPDGTGSVMAPVTPDYLAFGYTRRMGPLSCLTNSAEKIQPGINCQAVRKVFLNEVWAQLKEKSLSAVKAKMGRRATGELALTPGLAVLVFRGAERKLDYEFRLGHVVRILSSRTCMVIYDTGHEQVENFYNIVPVEAEAQEPRGGMMQNSD